MDKFTSRKFIIALLTAIGGATVALSEVGGDVGVVCGIITAVVAAVTYVITEGVIDAKGVSLIMGATEAVKEGVEELKDKEGE